LRNYGQERRQNWKVVVRVKFLWITLDGAGLPLAQRLAEEGHSVKVYIAHEKCASLYDGMIEKVDNLNFLARDSERTHYIVLDHVGILKPAIKLRTIVKTMGELGDHLRDLGFKVFGTSRFAERLELDRAFAKEVCQIANIPTPKTLPFSSLSEALQLIQRYKGRWVFKVDNNLAPTFVAHEPDSSDLVEHIYILMEDKGLPKQVTGTLEEYIEGVECSLEGWYQEGELIKGSLNITLETKVALPGQVGPAVGCSTSAVCPVEETSPLFQKTLAKLAGIFRHFRVTAPIDINTITPRPENGDPQPIFLEFCGGRFGYSAIFEFMELLQNDFAELIKNILDRKPVTIRLKPAWGYGIRVWHPPAPWTPDDPEVQKVVMKEIEGTRVWISPRAPKSIHRHLWWQDVKLMAVRREGTEQAAMVLCGTDGTIVEVTGVGSTIPQAAAMAEHYLKFLHTEHGDHIARIDGGVPLQNRWGVIQRWRLVHHRFRYASTSSSPAPAKPSTAEALSAS
jgi:hypothetical protein